jgi:general secretion pathway protein A
MLERHFGFNDDPFGATPDSRYLFYSDTHREALASLKYGFYANRGFTTLIAPPGMGKTTLLFQFCAEIQESARTVFLFDIDPECEPRELIAYILRDIGITPADSFAEMKHQLKEALAAESLAGRRFVVIIDEAQNLSEACLEMVRLLTNFETARTKLIQIVLAGQPQLAEKLMRPSLEQLRQRISTVCRLEPFSMAQTVAYIEHRLKVAGYAGQPLIDESAFKSIWKASRGTPRRINNLCFNALSLCRALDRRQVDSTMMAEIIADQELILPAKIDEAISYNVSTDLSFTPGDPKRFTGLSIFRIPAFTILLIVSVLIVPWNSKPRISGSRVKGNLISPVAASPAQVPGAVAAEPAKRVPVVRSKKAASFEITIEPHQSLQDVAVEYLGEFDLHRLHQIEALNPMLADPDHIEAGQRLRLPGHEATSEAKGATIVASERILP